MTHLNLIYPQWQGGGNDTSPFFGAQELTRTYLSAHPYCQIPVATEAIQANAPFNILGYEQIIAQQRLAQAAIMDADPDTIFTLGGGCDADVPSVAWLNRKYRGELAVLWFDAHGDLNTPEESMSKLFYGMPLRTLLGEGAGEMTRMFAPPLHPRQVLLLGTRELDMTEAAYISKTRLASLTASELQSNAAGPVEILKRSGATNIYIHLDLDVLDPAEFPHVPVPAPAGLSINTLRLIIGQLKASYHLVGIGLYEYCPSGAKQPLLEEIIDMGLGLG